ncbi:hypothetical protein PFISCL1PPCAC_27887, partial [Pristionchus fissidentatus]
AGRVMASLHVIRDTLHIQKTTPISFIAERAVHGFLWHPVILNYVGAVTVPVIRGCGIGFHLRSRTCRSEKHLSKVQKRRPPFLRFRRCIGVLKRFIRIHILLR